jgi:hypothetical protein
MSSGVIFLSWLPGAGIHLGAQFHLARCHP